MLLIYSISVCNSLLGMIDDYLGDFDVVPLLTQMIFDHPGNVELQKWIATSLKNFLNYKCLHCFRSEQIYNICLDNLEKYMSNADVVFEIISFLWHSVHFLCM